MVMILVAGCARRSAPTGGLKDSIPPVLVASNPKMNNVNFSADEIRLTFNELCNKNLGAEDYLEIVKVSKFIVIDQIPQFDDINSNQQHRFITLIDIIYDKKIPIAVTAEKNLNELTSSKSLKEPFNRTISRLYELTSSNFNL